MTRRLKIVVHAQHLTGVGHYVRGFEIAKALARRHEVHFVEGGRPVFRPAAPGLHRIQLPALVRRAPGSLAPYGDGAAGLEETMGVRRERLAAALRRVRPDVLLVEHFPFSKWELREEILAAEQCAREANPALCVVASLRDVCRKTRHEAARPEDYRAAVLGLLAEHFDLLLVHCDPRFTRLEEHLPWAAEIRVPIRYTGFVAEEPACRVQDPGLLAQAARDGFVVLSSGGGAGALPMVLAVLEAWRALAATPGEPMLPLVVFAGLFWSDREHRALERAAASLPARVLPFSPDFPAWVQASELSISRAGYNTCADVLRHSVRALLIPDEKMSDQRFRAERLAALDLAHVMPPGPPDTSGLVAAIRRALARPRPCHDLALDGAEATCQRIEELAG